MENCDDANEAKTVIKIDDYVEHICKYSLKYKPFLALS